uniref:Cytochrome P450 704B1 n=1 Tax=Hirondellea gigas TaxID=1518452 RepID=A0A6A7G693_9CRUS
MFDIQDIFARATMDAIGSIAFGQEIGCLDSVDPPAFMVEFDRCQAITHKRMMDPLWKFKSFFRVGEEKHFTSSMKVVNDGIYKLLSNRKSGNCENRKTVLDLLEEKATKDGNSFPDSVLRDIVWDFLIAGRDTTACASSWLFYCLLQHPDVLAKVYEEMEGKDISKFTTVLHEFPYLTACCLETERLYPSVPSTFKGVKAHNFTLPNGIKVESGTSLEYSPYINGRNPQIWGDDCLEWKPERFLTENNEIRQFSQGQYPSFNGGPRLCLGKTMALLEMKRLIINLFSQFDFELVPNRPITYKVAIILWIKDGLWVRATPRSK